MQNNQINSFKKYLSQNNPVIGKLYFGELNHSPDQGFELSIKSLENKISKAINYNIVGELWVNGSLNKNASVQDIERSVKLIIANPTLDQLGPIQDQMLDKPIAANARTQPEGYIEEVDPDKSQRIGVQQQALPEEFFEEKLPVTTADDRYFSLIRIFNEK